MADEEKYPGYMKVTIKKVVDVSSTAIGVFLDEIDVRFLITGKTKQKFNLPCLSAGDILFIKGRFGNKWEDLIYTRLAGIKV